MQFKVPQNIDMADRIVGPLTLVQFLYLLFGGMIVYLIFTTVAPVNPGLFVVTGGPIALFTLALAFLKIQDQPFPRFVGAFFVFLFKPKMRIWHKEGIDPNLVDIPSKVVRQDTTARKKIDKSQLDKLVQVLDTGGRTPTSTPPAAVPTMIKKSRPILDNVRKQ